MSKIQDFIIKNNIKPKECGYHTWRDVKSKDGKSIGKIRVLVPPNSDTAMVEYTCPECGHKDYDERPWKRPLYVKCKKCNNKIGVPKMKQQAKKEAKQDNAA